MSVDPKKIVGSSKVRKDKNSTTYSIEYYVKTDDLATDTPKIGDVADWTPVPARVTSVNIEELNGDRWIISIEAEADASAELGNISTAQGILDQFEWKYSTYEFFFRPRFWGVRQATVDDIKKSTTNITVKNIYGKTALVGDWIFINYANDLIFRGSADYTHSWFDAKSHPDISKLNKRIPISIFEVTFYSDKKPKYLKQFGGLNGSFPNAYDVYDSGIDGKWCTLSQKLESKQHDGENYVKVFRRFAHALDGKWNSKIWGGYWTSWEKGNLKDK